MFMVFILTVALIVGVVWYVNRDKEGESKESPSATEKDGVSKER